MKASFWLLTLFLSFLKLAIKWIIKIGLALSHYIHLKSAEQVIAAAVQSICLLKFIFKTAYSNWNIRLQVLGSPQLSSLYSYHL